VIRNFSHSNSHSLCFLSPGITDLLQRQTDQYTGSTRPKAFLNWVLLDEQFKIVNTSTGFEPVGSDGEFKTFVKTGLPISQNGYLYVYTSNESPVDVFFDNLQVTHVRGPLLEETHYYPFGLSMAGISTYASGCLKNKKKFIGQELDESFGLNWYQFRWRNHDAQLGRFIEVDPLADKYPYNSTYAYSENKVINGFDLEGLEFFAINPGWLNIALESNNVVTRGPFLENVVKTGSDIGTKTAEVGNKVPKIEDHHLIPKELKDNPIVELAREGGFKFEGIPPVKYILRKASIYFNLPENILCHVQLRVRCFQ
jgi:RHS repeat-associated protein